MTKTRTSSITAYFKTGIEAVWNIVTNNKDYSWRSDLSSVVEIKNGTEFIEYTKSGYETKFIITKKEQFNQYEFKIENKKFTGYWTGTFSETNSGGTKIVFTENIDIKNPIIRLLSRFFMNLEKMQKNYVQDLKIKLQEV